jgi:hypothetical protein
MKRAFEIQGQACFHNGENLCIVPCRKTCAGYMRNGVEMPLYSATDGGREATPEEGAEYRKVGRPVYLQVG